MNTILNQLLRITMEAATKEDFRCIDVRYHVSQPLAILVKLFVVDERTIDYIMIHAETDPPSNMVSTIKLFADLLITFSNLVITSDDPLNQFTCIALYNIIWSISFQPQYQEELKRNIELIDTIKRLKMNDRSQVFDQYKPRAMQSIKKAADGILYNLHIETNFSDRKSPKTTVISHTSQSIRAPIYRSTSLQRIDVNEPNMYVYIT